MIEVDDQNILKMSRLDGQKEQRNKTHKKMKIVEI